jgi:hypothetical protein
MTEGQESRYEANWNETRNLAGLPEGLVRSILGYAGESLVIGRALACGYNLFFKAWRDSKYDAVLDATGVLFRVEIKQSGDGTNISCTSGGRSGQQINREVDSREEVLSPEESDFLIGVHTFSGKCWVVPTEVVHFRGAITNATWSLADYEEKWKIFSQPPAGFTLREIQKGFRHMTEPELMVVARRLGITAQPELRYKFTPRNRVRALPSARDWYILEIWREIFTQL